MSISTRDLLRRRQPDGARRCAGRFQRGRDLDLPVAQLRRERRAQRSIGVRFQDRGDRAHGKKFISGNGLGNAAARVCFYLIRLLLR